ncbi:hypothetical protein ACFSMX_04980 [Flectobacillus roseus]|uniref:hypothetical protein n=1 Tax=Flectobacillus roseus TaxID=502259 RepID=UPI003628CB90
MSEINIVNLDQVTEVLGEKILSDKDFTKADLIEAKVEKPLEVDQVNFSFGLSGNFNIQLFNSPDDIDQDKVIGSNDAIIVRNPNEGWLKYKVESVLKSATESELKNSGFDITPSLDGLKKITLSSYRLHDSLTNKLRDSVISDFKPYLLIVNPDHLTKLKPREVLRSELSGSLKASVSLNWSDIFVGNLSLFRNLMGANQVLVLDIGTSLNVDFELEIKDNFSLSIQKTTDDTFDVKLKKSKSSVTSGGVSAGLTVGFKDPKAVQKILGNVAENLWSDLKGRIQPILDKNPLSKLNDTELKVVKQVAVYLGVDLTIVEYVADFQKVLEEKIGVVIEKIAKAKIELGFGYDYRRIKTSEVLFQAELNSKAIQKYHPSLIRFKLEATDLHPGILTDLRLAQESNTELEGVNLKSYLKETKLISASSWGFSLGILKWSLKGKDHLEIEQVVRENEKGNQQVAFKGVRDYTGDFFGDYHSWQVDFNAEMERFSQKTVPLANELNYSLYFNSQWKQPKTFGEEDMLNIVDQSVLWGVIKPEQFDSVYKQISDFQTGVNVKNVNASIHLKFNPDTFNTLILKIAYLIQHRSSFNISLIANALGASMSYRKEFAVRRSISARENLYGKLWKACMLDEDDNFISEIINDDERYSLALLSEEMLKKIGESALANEEKIDKSSSTGRSFSGLIHANPNTRIDWGLFQSGLVYLVNGINQGKMYEEIVKKSFLSMKCFWRQGHYVRALGYYLMQLVGSDFLREGIEVSLSVGCELNGQAKRINIIGK